MPKKHALIKDEISETSITTDKKQKTLKNETDTEEETSIELDEISVKSENEIKPQKKTKKPKMIKNFADQVFRASQNSNKFIGAHVSAAGGIENAIMNATDMGCRSFAFFVRNQRRWESKPMTDEDINAWDETIKKFNFPIDKIIPHGSYLLNPGSPEPEKLAKTREAMLEECRRCELLNIQYYIFHPGSTVGMCSIDECIQNVAETINYIQDQTSFVSLVIETMAGSGYTIGNTFQELRDIIDLVEDKSRVGVCIDTCHIFAAGYDLRTKKAYAKTMDEFEEIVGFHYLKAVHLNDSKTKLNSKVGRHVNIGHGELKLDFFKFLMRDSRFNGIPLILETPKGTYEEEMIELYEMESD